VVLRKQIRLAGYDYSKCGVYFITVCVKDRRPVLASIYSSAVAAGSARQNETETPEVELSEIGVIVDRAIKAVPEHYAAVRVEKYVIMPNHVHMIIRIDNGAEDAPASALGGGQEECRKQGCADIPRIVQQLKGYVTKQCGREIWQRAYYDHVIRNEQEYLDIWAYIEGNPAKWNEDELYTCAE